MAENPAYRSYVQGRLALAGIDLSAPVSTWLDSVYAIVCDAPHAVLEKMMKHMTIGQAKLRPEEARATWGLLPEHVALGGSLTQDGDATPPPVGRVSRPARPSRAVRPTVP